MPFRVETKTEMFTRCGRLCCLCLEQCGTNIEAAHIIDEARGGSNEADNGIPVCFDCHQEIGAYNDSHPRGNKFRPEELKARRDRVYHLVETGVMYAHVIAARARSRPSADTVPSLAEPSEPPEPSEEASQFLQTLLSANSRLSTPARKLYLLNDQDRAYILDKLVQRATKSAQIISVVAHLVQSPPFPQDQAILLVERVLRAVTLYGDVEAKAEVLRAFSDDILGAVYEGLRLAFFEDIIEIITQDQFPEVNIIVPAVIGHKDALPHQLYGNYVLALIKQARSRSHKGAPAARQALNALPDAIAKAGIEAMDTQFLIWNSQYEHLKEFATRYKYLITDQHDRRILDDLVALSSRSFFEKYFPEDPF